MQLCAIICYNSHIIIKVRGSPNTGEFAFVIYKTFLQLMEQILHVALGPFLLGEKRAVGEEG